jgi:very-short-patch-repair endonuclease
MRRLFTTRDALARGVTEEALRWGEQTGRWRRIVHGVYGEGPDDPTPFDRACALVLRCDGVASGRLAGVLLDLDSVVLDGSSPVRRRRLPPERVMIVGGIRCTDGLQTLVDLAPSLADDRWEQALESALRKQMMSAGAFDLVALGKARTPGTVRMRRVLARRPREAPPTESLLETLMVQLARTVSGLPDPIRQHCVHNAHGDFVARVDLCWPELGLFVELDGEQHRDQPVYDAHRQTAVTAATGWRCGRFTWTDLTRLSNSTARRLAALAGQQRS